MFADSVSQSEPPIKASTELALALDLDFLPERYRPRRLTLVGLRPLLLALGFALLLIPIGRYAQDAARQLGAVEAGLAEVQGELRGYQPLAEERAELEARIDAAQVAAAEIQLAYDSVDIQDIRWNRLLVRILSVRPVGVKLVALRQDGSELVLEGLAAAHDLPTNYAEALEGLSDFEAVILQSVTAVELAIDPEAEAEDPQALPEAGIAYSFEISAFLPVPAEEEGR